MRMNPAASLLRAGCLAFVGLCLLMQAAGQQGDGTGWPTYGGDAGGQRFSAATQISRSNVAGLHAVWTAHTHALESRRAGYRSAAFESTPILFHDLLYVTTPFDRVIALDPATGAERWTYDAPAGMLTEGQIVTNRGVAAWDGGGQGVCASRILIATLAGRLAAVDALTGKPCADFGVEGVVDLKAGLKPEDRDFSITSAPTVMGDVVVVGSSISDNAAVSMAHGTVRAYDVRTGRPRWTWEPIPWAAAQTPRTGAGNAWSTIAADPRTGLIFVPTGSASPDYYGGMRPGDDRDADSVVALDGQTGRKVWAFQVVHHNVWDYDVPAEPLLFLWHGSVPAVAIATKMGEIFVLDRRTGNPLIPVEERPVPQSDVPGEVTSPTQPFSRLPLLYDVRFPTEQVGSDRGAADAEACRAQVSKLRYEGLFTPPTLGGTLVYPGAVGGVNWGSAALDPATGILYANVNRLPYAVQLIRQDQSLSRSREHTRRLLTWVVAGVVLGVALLLFFAVGTRSARRGAVALVLLALAGAGVLRVYRLRARQVSVEDRMQGAFGEDHSPQTQAPYSLYRHPILDTHGLPCTPGLWGTVNALNLETGKMAWQQVLGDRKQGRVTGSISLGGPIVTAGWPGVLCGDQTAGDGGV